MVLSQTVVPCIYCWGAGTIRKRDMAGIIRFAPCRRCNGTGKRLTYSGSGEWRIAKQIIPGVSSPGPRKHDNNRGMFRR